MSIEWIKLENFQCHSDLKVVLDPHVTILTGDSGRGKSAVLRGLKWLLTNKPSGKSFIGKWRTAKYAKVSIGIDKTTITRIRGKTTNLYRMRNKHVYVHSAHNGNDSRNPRLEGSSNGVYKAFGGTVPQRIADLCNVGETNFQNQIDPPFWLTQSPSEVSRSLNKIINLKSIDQMLSLAAAEVRKTKSAVEVSKDRSKAAHDLVNESSWAVSFSTQVAELVDTYDKWQQIAIKSLRIDAATRGVSEAAQAVQNAANAVQMALAAMSVAEQYRAATTKRDRIGARIAQIEQCRALMTRPTPNAGPILTLGKRIQTLAERERQLHGLWLSVTNSQWEMDDAQREIDQLRKELKRFKGVCPTCQRPL